MIIERASGRKFGQALESPEQVPEEQVMEVYRDVKIFFDSFDFKLIPSEAAHLRKAIREIFFENSQIKNENEFDAIGMNSPTKEAIARFFAEVYHIDTQEFYKTFGIGQFENLFKLIKKRYREEQEEF